MEEIGRESIHLRDESFPLVGRAVSHEEFARLLAANPKNAALSTPEAPSRQEQPEETAEPIVGEVIEEPNPFVAQVMADAERLSAEDEPYHREPITYEAPYLDNLPTAPREKFAANIAAIQKLKEIEQRVANGGSPAFEDEQRILAQYTGWGGLSDAFDPNKSAWSNEYSQLKAALSEFEYEAARSSTLTAFYAAIGRTVLPTMPTSPTPALRAWVSAVGSAPPPRGSIPTGLSHSTKTPACFHTQIMI